MRQIPSLFPAKLSVEQTKNESQRFLEQRRRAYLIVGSIGVFMLLYNNLAAIQSKDPYIWITLLNNTLFALAASVLVGLAYLRRLEIELLEWAAFVLIVLEALIFNSAISWWLDWNIAMVFRETITDDVWLLVLVCTLALHIFPRRLGTLWALGLYLFSVLSVFTRVGILARTDTDFEQINIIVQNYVFGAMVLAFMFVLARYRYQMQRLGLEYQILERVAFLDALTGLPNRRRMYELTGQNLELSEQFQTPFCAALLDLDFFKRINDTFGHLRGDEALIRVADILRAELGERYPIGRWGGEEFLVLFPNTSLEDAYVVLERVRQILERSMGLEGERITVSGGVAAFRVKDTSIMLVGRADMALYRAKNTGRNRILTEVQGLLERV